MEHEGPLNIASHLLHPGLVSWSGPWLFEPYVLIHLYLVGSYIYARAFQPKFLDFQVLGYVQLGLSSTTWSKMASIQIHPRV